MVLSLGFVCCRCVARPEHIFHVAPAAVSVLGSLPVCFNHHYVDPGFNSGRKPAGHLRPSRVEVWRDSSSCWRHSSQCDSVDRSGAVFQESETRVEPSGKFPLLGKGSEKWGTPAGIIARARSSPLRKDGVPG